MADDGLAAFTRLYGAQQQQLSAAKPNDAERALRLFKGLAEAKSRVDQATIEDAQFPDLYDQLSNQSEPQNYFFEPYASQWCPQLVRKGNLIPLPSVIATSLEEELQALTLSGLLPEIGHAWTSVDHRLFLWNYKQRGRFAVFEMDQPVVSVGLCVAPKTGVFTDKVKHLLVVATTVEVVLVAVLYEDNKTLASGLRLQRTKLSVSADNTVVRRIATTAAHGRIFFGGSDGGVYELLYGAGGASSTSSMLGVDTSLFIPSFLQRSGCRKVTHTSQLANYLPSFLSSLASSAGKLLEFAIDEDRHILYALHEQGDIDVFDLGAQGNEMKLVCTLNLLQEGAKYARENRRTRVSCPDERLFQTANLKIVSLAVVGRDESALVNVVALASNGMRFYITVYSRRTYTVGSSIPPSKRPTRLEILFIRLPPPAVTLVDAPPYHAKEGMQPGFAPGKSPSSVHFGFYKHGVSLLVDGAKDQQDRVVGIAHDPITHSTIAAAPTTRGKTTTRESVAVESCIGKIVDVQELDETSLEQSKRIRDAAAAASSRSSSAGSKRSFDEMTGPTSSVLSNDAVPIVGEMALQYSAPSRHFLCLSNAGIQVFKKIRPIDQLHRVLLLTRGSDLKGTLAPFIRSFGDVQVCCMLIALACGVQSDPLTVDGNTAAATAASASVIHRAGVKSDEYIFTTAMQGIFECGQIARATGAVDMDGSATTRDAANTRIVLTTDFGMSYQHDGLVMFMTRVLRPVWFPKTIGRRISSSTSTVTYEPVHSKELLDEIREVLFQLRQLMETAGPYAVSIGSGSVLVESTLDDGSGDPDGTRAAELALRYQKLRNEDQRKREMRFKAEQRSLFLLYQIVLRSIEAISLLRLTMEFQVPLEESFAKMSFGDLVSTAEGLSASKLMVKALMKGRDENNQFLVQQLREQCPSFFTVNDLWHYQGYKSLAMAKLSAPSGRKAHLKESLRQFLNACHMWDTEDCVEVLQGICDDYALLNYYEGVVKLALACAKNFHDAASTDLTGVKQTWKRNCFGSILLSLQRLLDGGKPRSGQSPQAVEDMVSLDDASRKGYVEEIFHYALASEDSDFHQLLYSWLYEHGQATLLTSIRSSFIEDYLKERDQDLLVKMYMEQHNYLVAAKVWWARAHEDNAEEGMGLESNPDVVKRQYYVSKALGCLKSMEDVGEAADAIREVRDVLDVLQLQVRVLKALEQATVELEASTNAGHDTGEIAERKQDLKLLTFKIYDATTLYNQFASKYDMWSECLHIIHACNSEEADVIELLWRKIVFDMVPPSASSNEFNAWRLDQYELAGLPTGAHQVSMASSFESGYWIGQMQMKVLRLGKSLYTDGNAADSRSGGHSAAAAALSSFVFPVGFLAKQLERIASWHLRLTQLPAYAWSASSSAEATTFNWVLKMFLEVGVPHRVLLSYYERLYREQGTLDWTLHLLQSIYAILVLWKKHASSPRAANDQLAEYAACCPHIVAICDDIVTDLKALSSDERNEVHLLLDQFRRYKTDLMTFRNPV